MPLTIQQIGCSLASVGHLLDLLKKNVRMQIDDQHTDLAPIRAGHWGGHANHRTFGLLYLSELDIQIQRRDIDLPGLDAHRITKIVTISLGLQRGLRYDINALRLPVDPHPFLTIGSKQANLIDVGIKTGQRRVITFQTRRRRLNQPLVAGLTGSNEINQAARIGQIE